MEHDSKIRKVIFNEVSLAIALVGVVVSIMFWIMNPQTESRESIIKLQARVESTETVTAALQKIKDNDLHEMQLRMDRIENRQLEQLESQARLEAKVDILLNKLQ